MIDLDKIRFESFVHGTEFHPWYLFVGRRFSLTIECYVTSPFMSHMFDILEG